MRKLMILAISAILVANMSAQEPQRECPKGKPSKAERVEFEIKRLTNELLLSDEQAEKFAATYREYAAKLDELFRKNKPEQLEKGKELTDKALDKMAKLRFEGQKELAELQAKFYDKFRKDLSARQVERVLRLDGPFGGKPCCGQHDGKPGCKKEGGKCAKPEGPRPDFQPAEQR